MQQAKKHSECRLIDENSLAPRRLSHIFRGRASLSVYYMCYYMVLVCSKCRDLFSSRREPLLSCVV